MIPVAKYLLISIASFIVFAGVSYGEIYKWVDENGKVHYSDRKIENTATKMNVGTGQSSIDKNTGSSNQQNVDRDKLLNAMQSDRLERQEKREQEKAKQAEMIRYCNTLKDQLKSYQEEYARWYVLDEDTGERRFMSDEELSEEITSLKKEIKSQC